VITSEETENLETDIDVVKGMRFDRSYLSPEFITNAEKSVAELDEPYILIHEKKLFSLHQLLPVLEAVVQSGRPLLIIAQDVIGEALATLVINKVRGGLKVAVVKAPGFGDRRKAMLEDISILTSGQLISEELGIKLENVTLQMLGRAKKVIITKHDTTILCDSVEDETYPLKAQIADTTADYDREKPVERLVNLHGGIAVIRVGGSSEVEVKEKRGRVDDALSATRAAVKEGIVPGGGVALLKASKILDHCKGENDDQDAGVAIMRRALQAPARQIAENAGVEGSIVVEKILENASPTFGFDAQTKQYVDMIQAGIIDAAKIVRTALQEAASAAGLLITTEGAILEAPKKNGGSAVGMPDSGGAGDTKV
jgi:chaperonin GroEL